MALLTGITLYGLDSCTDLSPCIDRCQARKAGHCSGTLRIQKTRATLNKEAARVTSLRPRIFTRVLQSGPWGRVQAAPSILAARIFTPLSFGRQLNQRDYLCSHQTTIRRDHPRITSEHLYDVSQIESRIISQHYLCSVSTYVVHILVISVYKHW